MTTPAKIEIGEITDPEELAQAREQREQFDRNAAWLHEHASHVYPEYRGQYICIAGREVFAAETPEEAVALAEAAHPLDKGRFARYIPRQKVPRIYAYPW